MFHDDAELVDLLPFNIWINHVIKRRNEPTFLIQVEQILNLIKFLKQQYFSDKFYRVIFGILVPFENLDGNYLAGFDTLCLRHAPLGSSTNNLNHLIFILYFTPQSIFRAKFIFLVLFWGAGVNVF